MDFSQTNKFFIRKFQKAILNKRLLLAVAIQVMINRRRRRRYDFRNVRRRFWINSVFSRRNVSVFFVNLTEEMRKDDREIYFR